MARNGVAFTESIAFARGLAYPYRTGLGMFGSAEWCVLMDDFTGPVTSNLPFGWAAAIIDTGATIVTDPTVGSLGATGVLLFDSDGATEGAAFYGAKGLQLTSGKRFFMEMRFQTEIANDTDVQFGLSSANATTNPEDLWTTAATDVIAFGVLDGSAVTGMLSDKSNGGTVVQAGTISLSAATWHVLGIGFDGTNLTGWVDGQLSLLWSGAASTIPMGVPLVPFVGYRNGSAATNEGHCDYLRYVLER